METVAVRELVQADEGLVSARIFGDPELYRRELERIFGRVWLFVAHESEIPRPGDFVTRTMGEDPVIVVRGADGEVRVLLNVCRHRGRKVCGEDAGRAATFRCGYHGWTYTSTGALTSVPFFEAYQGKLDKDSLGLRAAPQVDSYHGLIFACWDPDAPALGDYLGGMQWVFDLLFGRTDGMEVVGPPMRWSVDADWKLGAGNFAGDGHHILTTHGFRTALDLETVRGRRTSYSVTMEDKHAAALSYWPDDLERHPYFTLPKELWPEVERHLTPVQREVFNQLMIVVGNAFPNLSFLSTASHTPAEWGGPEGQAMSFLTARQWQPRGPGRIEVWSWQLVDKNAPEWWKDASRHCYSRVFGAGGIFEQDDMENWSEITGAVRGPIARRLWLQYTLGLDDRPSPTWPGPGEGYLQRGFMEVAERVFYGHWQQLMERE
jgi:phenylpropionate dioxygenase-like ring-hydroxylating dioxygenase large terminal subunit